jgi:hypothetical protein
LDYTNRVGSSVDLYNRAREGKNLREESKTGEVRGVWSTPLVLMEAITHSQIASRQSSKKLY